MQDNFTESRNLNSTAVPGLSDEAREAVNAAFDAMSTWRVEAAKRNEKHSQEVIEKMAVAARALGWPEQIVDATRAQLQSITKLQIQVLDNLMDVWEEQIKSPNPMTASSAMLSKLKSWPDAKPAGACDGKDHADDRLCHGASQVRQVALRTWRRSISRAQNETSRDPSRLTQEFSKADRGGRILVDTGRNGYSATFAAGRRNENVETLLEGFELDTGRARPGGFKPVQVLRCAGLRLGRKA